MTNKLSMGAQARLDELQSLPLKEAAVSCLLPEIILKLPANPSSKRIVTELRNWLAKNSNTCHLFADPTSWHPFDDIHEKSSREIREGFTGIGNHRYTLASPFDWNGPEGCSRTHRYKINAWLMIGGLLRSHSIGGEEKTYNISKDIAMDWINNHIFGEREDDFAWYDMGVGQRSCMLSYITYKSIMKYKPNIFSWFFGKTSRTLEDIFKLIVASEIHMIELMDEERLALHSNHGLFQMSGLLSLSETLPFMPSSKFCHSFSTNNIQKMLKSHFFQDGFHKEHSPMYHMFMTNYLTQLRLAGWLGDNAALHKLADKAEETASWYVLPDQTILPLGDSKPNYPLKSACLFNINTDEKGYISAPQGFFHHKKGGLAILSTYSDNRAIEHLTFSAQFHSRMHKHSDDLSIHYCVFGKQYLIDSGTYSYQYDAPERMYIESAKAHNTLTIDGLNYSRFRNDIYGSSLKLATQIGPYTLMEGFMHHRRLIPSTIPNNKVKTSDSTSVDIKHRRRLFTVPGKFLVVLDEINSESNHEYTQWFHFDPNLSIEGESESILQVKDGNKLHSSIHFIVEESCNFNVKMLRGNKKPELQGWCSKDGMRLVENTAIGLQTTSKSTHLLTLFDLTNSAKKPYLKIGTGGKYLRFTVEIEQRKYDIVSREKFGANRSILCKVDDEEFTLEIEEA
tara:strand:- start:331 stop:2370 length:2040 start_codon:yes stop_codon:yes gene_type:complete